MILAAVQRAAPAPNDYSSSAVTVDTNPKVGKAVKVSPLQTRRVEQLSLPAHGLRAAEGK
jgi:hypothetical protein